MGGDQLVQVIFLAVPGGEADGAIALARCGIKGQDRNVLDQAGQLGSNGF